MSYSYRLSCFAAVGWIAVACVLGGAGAGLAYVEGMEATGRVDSHLYPPGDTDGADAPSQRRAEKHPKPRIVNGNNGSGDASAYSGANNNSREDVPEQADRGTIAAESQARYARWQTCIAFFALIFSVVGTALLVWTLCETRKTANASVRSASSAKDAANIARQALVEAKRAAEDTNRAWVVIDPIRSWIKRDGDEITVYIKANIRNIGTSPARVDYRFNAYKSYGNAIAAKSNIVNNFNVGGTWMGTIFPGKSFIDTFNPSIKIDKVVTLCVDISVFYMSVNSDTMRRSILFLEILSRDGEIITDFSAIPDGGSILVKTEAMSMNSYIS